MAMIRGTGKCPRCQERFSGEWQDEPRCYFDSEPLTMVDDGCLCAVDLTGLIELSHPKCTIHFDKPAFCPLHGGDWVGYQCEHKHDATDDVLLEEIIRIRKEALEFAWKAATQVALYGSAFIQVIRNPQGPNDVRLLDPEQVFLHTRKR